MNCKACGKPIKEDWKVCPFCEIILSLSCTNCGDPMEPDWKVCPSCGFKVNAIGTKKRNENLPPQHSGQDSHAAILREIKKALKEAERNFEKGEVFDAGSLFKVAGDMEKSIGRYAAAGISFLRASSCYQAQAEKDGANAAGRMCLHLAEKALAQIDECRRLEKQQE